MVKRKGHKRWHGYMWCWFTYKGVFVTYDVLELKAKNRHFGYAMGIRNPEICGKFASGEPRFAAQLLDENHHIWYFDKANYKSMLEAKAEIERALTICGSIA